METHFNPTKSKVISIGRMNSNQSNEMSVVVFFFPKISDKQGLRIYDVVELT